MNNIYVNAMAEVDAMKKHQEKNSLDIEFLSTHPNIDKRINYIKEYSH